MFLHQSQTQDHATFCREVAARAPVITCGVTGGCELPFAEDRADWTVWMTRTFGRHSELIGVETPQPQTMCVLPGTTALDIFKGDPARTGVCLPHAVTAASGGGRQAALARHRGDGEELKRIEAVYSRLHRTGATHLAAWTASKPTTRAAEGVAEQPAGVAAVAPSSVAEPADGVAAVAPSSVAVQLPADAAAAANSAPQQPPPRSGGAPKKKGKARKRVTHVTIDTNVMD